MGKINLNCDNCGKTIFKYPCRLRTRKNHFCSRKCHSKWTKKQHIKPHNFKAFYVKCEVCGKISHRPPSGIKKHMFCSIECYLKFYRVTLTCPFCKKMFVRRKSRLTGAKNHFCSRKCSHKWHVGERNGSYSRESRKCVNCDGVFEVRPAYKKKFCSKQCMNEWFSKSRLKENNPYWKPKVDKICDICGKEFQVHPSNKNRRLCSWKCWLKWIRTVRKISEKNRKNMLKALIKRPTKPEKILIDIIEKYNFPFKYVGDGEVIINGFNPDFINESHKLIIEVFGDYWHNPEICGWRQTEQCKKIVFGKVGYKMLVIWERELKQNSEGEISEKISSWLKCR